MKEYIDITKEIMALHNNEVIKKISREIDDELKNGIPSDLKKQVSKIIEISEYRIISGS